MDILLGENKISNNLIHTTSISHDEEYLYLKIDYMDGKYTINRSFKNNSFALDDMNSVIKSLNSEEKIRSYFGLDFKQDKEDAGDQDEE